MKLVKTQGRGGKEARKILLNLEQRGAQNTARTMPVVQRIIADVRKGGDKALRRYAAKLDGLDAKQPFLITREEMAAAWESTPKPLQDALETAAGNIRRFASLQMPKDWSETTDGAHAGPARTAAGRRGLLRPQWTLSAALHLAYDRHSRPGGRRDPHRGRFRQAGQRDPGRSGSARASRSFTVSEAPRPSLPSPTAPPPFLGWTKS